MKALNIFSVLALLFSLCFSAKAQDYGDEKLNLPGDNLNLYAVMKLFQESETLEGFERNLNAEDSKINNLDLNGNNLIDYIKVIDYADGDAHTIVLQVAINDKENQDVAVITVFKDNNGLVQIQLVGDEYLYGKDYIIEPNYDDNLAAETPNPGYTGNTSVINGETVVVTKTTYVEVQSWPVVRYIYTPTYVVWHSPWYWGYYPSYWNPWRPYYYDYYYGYHSNWHHHYYSHYRHNHYYRSPYYSNNYYHGHRAYSATVRSNKDSGRYKDTYSRPDLREEGVAEYKRKIGNANPSSVRPETNDQDRTKPAVQPGKTRPTTNPAETKPSVRPTGKPGLNKPAVQPGKTSPSTRPAVHPGKTNPSAKPAVQPGKTSPSTRPAETRTSTKTEQRKPSVQPGKTSPTARPAETKPSTRQSSGQQVSKPANRQGNSGSSVKSSSGKSSARTPAKTAKSNPDNNKGNGGR